MGTIPSSQLLFQFSFFSSFFFYYLIFHSIQSRSVLIAIASRVYRQNNGNLNSIKFVICGWENSFFYFNFFLFSFKRSLWANSFSFRSSHLLLRGELSEWVNFPLPKFLQIRCLCSIWHVQKSFFTPTPVHFTMPCTEQAKEMLRNNCSSRFSNIITQKPLGLCEPYNSNVRC